MKIIYQLIIFASLAISLEGCIFDSSCDCPQEETLLGVKFRYATTPPAEQQNGGRQLSVFIFNEEGLFVSQVNTLSENINNDYTIELPYKEGNYQFVVWDGYDENLYQLSEYIPGRTYIDDFYLSLKREENSAVSCQPSLLYHGIHEIVNVENNRQTIVWIDLKQITNRIRIIAHNLNPSDQISIEDNNGKYDYTSRIVADGDIIYTPFQTTIENQGGLYIADFQTMKLDESRNPCLRIKDGSGRVRYEENLIRQLLAKTPEIDFEKDHDFTIEIFFEDYIPIYIKINGWEVIIESHCTRLGQCLFSSRSIV